MIKLKRGDKMKKILLIEDDEKIRRYLELEMRYEGYAIDIAENGKSGLEKIKIGNYDIVLLDLMMPEMSGEEVCEKIRKESDIPIIIITSKDATFSKISLLDLGADDYITKPFVIGELLARMRVALRNKKDFKQSNVISYDNIKMDLQEKTVFVSNEKITVTKTEYNLLHYLILNREIVLSREQILSNVWGYDYNGEEKIVDIYIKNLRKKIDIMEKKIIQTVRGFGYILKGGNQ
jgi:DNA-binding response OmpR family regulator